MLSFVFLHAAFSTTSDRRHRTLCRTGLCSARETTLHNPAKSERCSASRPRRQRLPRQLKQRCFVSSQKQAMRLRRRVSSSQSRNTLKKTARKLSSRSSLRCGFLSFRFSMFLLVFIFVYFFNCIFLFLFPECISQSSTLLIAAASVIAHCCPLSGVVT